MKDKPNMYGILPANVRYHEGLSEFAKVLFSEINALSNKNGYCHASNAYFERVFQKTRQTVSRTLTTLKDCGAIEIEDGQGGDAIRRIIPCSPSQKLLGSVNQKLDTTHVENVKQNNTSIIIQDTISKDIVETIQIRLPVKGKSSIQRLVNFYSFVWKERYGRLPVQTNYALLGKQLKPTFSLLSEYQLALVVMQYFHWKGTTGTDEFGYKRLVDKAFPLHWVPNFVDEILVYWRNEIGVDPDNENEVKRVVDAKIRELGIEIES